MDQMAKGIICTSKIGETGMTLTSWEDSKQEASPMFLYPHQPHRRFGLAKSVLEQPVNLAHVVFCSKLE